MSQHSLALPAVLYRCQFDTRRHMEKSPLMSAKHRFGKKAEKARTVNQMEEGVG
jgi:hypothetical protein